jgi:GntR family transcriptional repressor for pyruvate dehydrogenase complex
VVDKRFTAIKQTRTYIEIVDQIVNLLREGQIRPGEQLPSERRLSLEFGTGRQSLREAFSALEVMKVLEVKAGKGAFIRADALIHLDGAPAARFSEEDSPFELLQARKIVEPKAAALAARKISVEEIAELETILRPMETNRQAGFYSPEPGRKFHLVIMKASGNVVLYRFLCAVMERMSKSLWNSLKGKSLEVPGRFEKYHAEHLAILRAFRDRDSKQAEKAVFKHLSEVEKDILNS